MKKSQVTIQMKSVGPQKIRGTLPWTETALGVCPPQTPRASYSPYNTVRK